MGLISYNAKMLVRLAVKRSPYFHAAMAEMEEFRGLQAYEQRAEQLRLLEEMLKVAEGAPYYAEALGATRRMDNPMERLKRLAPVDKEEVRRAPRAFCTRRWGVIPAHTSGTTGTPLRLWRDLYSVAREEAGFFRWYLDHGYAGHETMGVLRGDVVVPARRIIPPFGVRDYIFNRYIFSSYHLADRTMGWYVRKMREQEVRTLAAYPSSAYVLADYLRRSGAEPLRLAGVFLGSETVMEWQRGVIEEFLGPVQVQYGNAERVAWMTTCAAGCYHEDTQYGLVEYLPAGEGMFEIVATGLTNAAMPLVRYRTGDLATEPFGFEQRCACGRLGPGCRQIMGRMDDVVVTPDGRKIGRLDHVFKGVAHVIAGQIVQETRERVVIKIVRDDEYTRADEEQIRVQFAERAGTAMEVKCEYVEALPRGPGGKFRAVISHVKEG